MRISDWSSDVCSSDLRRIVLAGDRHLAVDDRHGGHPVFPALNALALFGQVIGDGSVPAGGRSAGAETRNLAGAAVELPVRIDNMLRIHIGRKIGRATWRERECKDVEISVGAE